MDKIIRHSVPVTRPKIKRVPTDDGRGTTSKPNGTRTAMIEIEINMTDLVQHLGVKAMFNKTRRARGLGGIVKVSAMNVVDKP
jgi:hypothetical protein